MNPKHLHYFVTVVQRGSLKSAAASLGITQPAISAAIRKLEAELGVPLLARDAQGSGPTPYGRSLYASAQTMASVVESAKRKIAALKDPSAGHLRIGTGPSVSVRRVSQIIANAMADYPGLRIDHVAGNSYGDFEQRLLAEDIDVAFCCIRPKELPRAIACRPVSSNPIGMMMNSEFVSARARSVRKDDILQDFTWIVLRDDEIRPPPGIDLSATPSPLQPQLSVTVDDLNMIKQLTLSTKAIGFFPIEDALTELLSGQLVDLYVENVAPSLRPIFALTKAGSYLTPTLELFLEKIQTERREEEPNFTHRRLKITG